MAWIVTPCSQCNYWANTQACALSPTDSGGCVFVCLSKHPPPPHHHLSIFWRWPRISLKRKDQRKSDLIEKSEGNGLWVFTSLKKAYTVYKDTWRRWWWWWILWLNRTSQRGIYFVFMKGWGAIMFTDVQSGCSVCLWLVLGGQLCASLPLEKSVTWPHWDAQCRMSNSSHGTLSNGVYA